MGAIYSLDDELDGLIESIELAQDERTIKQTLRNFAYSLGFNRFAYLDVRGNEVKALSNYPAEWQNIYLEGRLSQIDPVVAAAKRSREPFVWAQNETSCSSDNAAEFFGKAAAFGIRSGLSIPVRGSFGRTAILTLASDRASSADIGVSDAARAITAVAFVHVHLNCLARGLSNSCSISLTPREMHCLAWASHGKTRSETAALLGIKEPTVRFYTESAFEKLGAVNVTHAVRLALEKGLI